MRNVGYSQTARLIFISTSPFLRIVHISTCSLELNRTLSFEFRMRLSIVVSDSSNQILWRANIQIRGVRNGESIYAQISAERGLEYFTN